MSAFEILLIVYAAVLALAALAVVYRMIVGPTILDRAISSDSLVTLVVMGMALHVAHTGAAWAGPAMLSLAGLAFVGTVTFAGFVAREDPMQGRLHPHHEEPGTDTGPHEAIHLETDSASEDGFGAEDDFGAEGSRGFESDPSAEEGLGADGSRGVGSDRGVESDRGVGSDRGVDPDAGSEEGFGADGSGAEGPRGFEDEHEEGTR
jgi:multicomponent Na+:H+ antiporter subunit F